MELSFSILPQDKKDMIEYEKIRFEAFCFVLDGIDFSMNMYVNHTELLNYLLLVVVRLFYNQELNALAYVTNKNYSLYIEQLFVRKSIQGKLYI